MYIEGDGNKEPVVVHGDHCDIISKSQFQRGKRGGSDLYITSQLIDILADKVGFDHSSRLLLDIGGTYVLDTKHGGTVDDEFMLASYIATNSYIKQALSVDLRKPTLAKHQRISVLGDVLDPHIQHTITQRLGSKPNMIIASQVLIDDLEEYMEYEYIRVPVGKNKLLHEELAKTTWELLDNGGLLLVNNKCPIKSSDAGIPQFLRDRSHHLRFLVEDGLTRVYQK
ncbi:MAG: hypothetical protein WC004_00855 [Candidatus Absconditabacterales bacterium]